MKNLKNFESFIKDFVKDLEENNVAVFAGAGMSRSAGYVDWQELLRDIAADLGLSIDKEHDLLSIAQYHVNENGGRARINQKILEEFAEDAESTENHKILARLPVTTFWTTNYDTLIEESLKAAHKVSDVKYALKHLATTRPKRDVVVYKMHGDVHHPADAVLTKEQFETYYRTHEHFVTALSGDLISKTFLFIGFSFTDPNLQYVLSRLNFQFGENTRQHYCFIKKQAQGDDDEDIFKYNTRKQQLMISDLRRYKIKALLVDEYEDITKILEEVERRFRKKTVFISGSAEVYGQWNREEAQKFIHSLSKKLVLSGFRIVNGFGWGVGSAIINGALEAIYEKPEKLSEDQLIMKPFPQFQTGTKDLNELWEEYRHKMIAHAGIAVFIFGNKNQSGELVLAGGVKKEFDIAISKGLIPLPIGATGYISAQLYAEIKEAPGKFLSEEYMWIMKFLEELSAEDISTDEIIKKVVKIIQEINK